MLSATFRVESPSDLVFSSGFVKSAFDKPRVRDLPDAGDGRLGPPYHEFVMPRIHQCEAGVGVVCQCVGEGQLRAERSLYGDLETTRHLSSFHAAWAGHLRAASSAVRFRLWFSLNIFRTYYKKLGSDSG